MSIDDHSGGHYDLYDVHVSSEDKNGNIMTKHAEPRELRYPPKDKECSEGGEDDFTTNSRMRIFLFMYVPTKA